MSTAKGVFLLMEIIGKLPKAQRDRVMACKVRVYVTCEHCTMRTMINASVLCVWCGQKLSRANVSIIADIELDPENR